MDAVIITGTLNELDGQFAYAGVGDHRITGLSLDQLKALGPHLFETVRITISPLGNMDIAKVIRLDEVRQVVRDTYSPGGCHEEIDHGLMAELESANGVLIESDNGFWRPGGSGYCLQENAGRFSGADAYSRTNHCGPEKQVRFHLLRKA